MMVREGRLTAPYQYMTDYAGVITRYRLFSFTPDKNNTADNQQQTGQDTQQEDL